MNSKKVFSKTFITSQYIFWAEKGIKELIVTVNLLHYKKADEKFPQTKTDNRIELILEENSISTIFL